MKSEEFYRKIFDELGIVDESIISSLRKEIEAETGWGNYFKALIVNIINNPEAEIIKVNRVMLQYNLLRWILDRAVPYTRDNYEGDPNYQIKRDWLESNGERINILWEAFCKSGIEFAFNIPQLPGEGQKTKPVPPPQEISRMIVKDST